MTPEEIQEPLRRGRRADGRRPRTPAWRGLVLIAALASVAFLGLVIQLPTQHEAAAVIGLRSEPVAGGQPQTSPDELQLIAQQYTVALSADTEIDVAIQELRLDRDASVRAEVDPGTTTVRIAARADQPGDATRLAQQVADRAADLADDDETVTVSLLSPPDARHTTTTPPKPLVLGVGIIVIALGVTGLGLFRGR